MKKDDTLWKGLLEDLFEEFLQFIFEEQAVIFDFSKPFEFLNNELAQIFPVDENAEYPKYVDKLVKVFTTEGEEEWVLVHVEVQGYDDKNFAARMFKYFYRILDKYNKRVTCVAIFTGDTKKAAQLYKYNFLGTKASFEYNVYKIAAQSREQLVSSSNVFALVVLAVLNTLQQDQLTEDELIRRQISIARVLLQKQIPRRKISTVFYFLRYYVHFANPENVAKFDTEIISLHANNNAMGLEEMLVERAEKRGIEKGIEEGIEKGVEKSKESFVETLLQNTDFDTAKIAMLVGVSQAYVQDIKAESGGRR